MKNKRILTLVSALLVLGLLAGVFGCTTPSPAPIPTPTPTSTSSPFPITTSITTPTPTPTPTKPLEVKEWRFGTSVEGSFGYIAASAVAKVVNKYSQSVKLMVVPAKSSTENHYMYDRGDLDTVLVSSLQMIDYFANAGSYAKKPLVNKTPIGLAFFGVGGFMITKAERTDLKSYGDLVGKNLAPSMSGSMNWITIKAIMEKLGYWSKINDRQMALMDIADALNKGVVDAAFTYVNSGVPPDWLQNIDTVVKIRVVDPSPEEKQKISTIPGYVPMEISASPIKQDIGTKNIWTLSYLMGWNFGPREDIDRAYEITKISFEHADEIAAMYSGLVEFAQDPWKMNIGYIDSLPGIPVHPGVAKYFKEMGKWKSEWKIAELSVK